MTLSLLALILGTGPVHYEVVNYMVPSDCPQGHLCDLYPAFVAAAEACNTDPPRDNQGVGCKLELPAGDYRWSDTPTLCRGHEVYGQGGDRDYARTILHTDVGVGCFVLESYGYCDADGPVNGWARTDGAELRGFACFGTVSSTYTVGILSRSSAHIKDVTVRRYTQGIVISAGTGRTPKSNANLWSLEDVHTWNIEHAGIFVDGEDANAGVALRVDANDTCRDSSWEGLLGGCHAIDDSSFLGNSWYGVHVEASGGGSFRVGDSANSRAVALAPYIESPGTGLVTKNAQVFGSIGGTWLGQGLVFLNRRPNGLEFMNSQEAGNPVTLRVGDLAAPGSAWDATALGVSGGAALRLKARPQYPGGRWGFNVFNVSPANDSFQIQLFSTPEIPLGTVLE